MENEERVELELSNECGFSEEIESGVVKVVKVEGFEKITKWEKEIKSYEANVSENI